MDLSSVRNRIKTEIIKDNVQFKDITTFRVGGNAGLFVEPRDESELIEVLSVVKEEKVPYMVVGNGSNLLVSDDGYEGVVIRLSGSFCNLSCSDNSIYAGAGVMVSKLCTLAKDMGLSGLEFAYGIPGTVGGAMVMNAGAYDGEMSYVVESVDLVDSHLNAVTLSNAEMKFAYRHSILKDEEYVVTGARFKLTPGNCSEIDLKMQDFLGRRRSKQPLEHPSAGSTFKRPEGFFAGKLIEDSGLKGYRIGGASVSDKHCGFIVNDREGSAGDINNLMNYVTKKVYEDTGVTLEPEVIKIGRF